MTDSAAGRDPGVWNGEDNDHIEVLDRQLGSDFGWLDNVEYEFSIGFRSDGTINMLVQRADNGQLIWETSLTDPDPLPPGKIAFFNYSQSDVRYRGLQESDILPEGAYQVIARSGQPGLRSVAGTPLDGDGDGTAGDDYVGMFVVDQTPPQVADVLFVPDGIEVFFDDISGMLLIYVSSGAGVEIFDPVNERFEHFSDFRVGNMAFAPDGTLWAAAWPDRGDVARFDDRGDPELMPPDAAVVALPRGSLSITFDQDMYACPADDPASVTDPANYTLTGEQSGEVEIEAVTYDPQTRSAALHFSGIGADGYELTVGTGILSDAGVALLESFTSTFVAVTDLSAFVDLEFFNARSDRAEGTISYDVRVTNTGDADLLLPLVLSPGHGFTGVPAAATEQAESGAFFIDLSGQLPSGGQLGPNESTVGRTITVLNPDGQRVDFDSAVAARSAPNEAPQFDSTPVTEAAVGQPYEYQVAGSDPDGPTVLYVLADGPEGMAIDPVTGLLTWVPGANTPPRVPVTIQVYDNRGASATQRFDIDVADADRAPEFTRLPDHVRLDEGEPFELAIGAADPEDLGHAARRHYQRGHRHVGRHIGRRAGGHAGNRRQRDRHNHRRRGRPLPV